MSSGNFLVVARWQDREVHVRYVVLCHIGNGIIKFADVLATKKTHRRRNTIGFQSSYVVRGKKLPLVETRNIKGGLNTEFFGLGPTEGGPICEIMLKNMQENAMIRIQNNGRKINV